MPDPNTVAIVLALFIAALGVFLGLPYMLRRIEGQRRQKRQEAVREIIRRRGVATKTDMNRDGMRESDAIKAISEMHHSGEIIPSQGRGEVALWRFRIHPQYNEKRTA